MVRAGIQVLDRLIGQDQSLRPSVLTMLQQAATVAELATVPDEDPIMALDSQGEAQENT